MLALPPGRGEIWFAYLPGRPDDPHQPRPVLVMSDDVRNRLTDDLIVVPIFTRGRLGPTRVAIQAGAGGLQHSGVVFGEEVTTLDRDFLARGPLGPGVPQVLLEQVVIAIRRAIGEVIPPI